MHKTTAKGEALLDRILKNTSFTGAQPAEDNSITIEEVP